MHYNLVHLSKSPTPGTQIRIIDGWNLNLNKTAGPLPRRRPLSATENRSSLVVEALCLLPFRRPPPQQLQTPPPVQCFHRCYIDAPAVELFRQYTPAAVSSQSSNYLEPFLRCRCCATVAVLLLMPLLLLLRSPAAPAVAAEVPFSCWFCCQLLLSAALSLFL